MEMEAGFAKLQGEDFEYYMQTYSIILGRNSKKSAVDVDLAGLGGGMSISRQHARILYDFERRRFVLEVLGKNGCYVEGVLHLPSNSPVKLDSQDLLQIGDKKFYFLLPTKKIARSVAMVPTPTPNPKKRPAGTGKAVVAKKEGSNSQPAKKMRGQSKNGSGGSGKERKHQSFHDEEASLGLGSITGRDGYRYDDEHEHLREQIEEHEVIDAVATKLHEQNQPGEWMAVPKLHSDILDHFRNKNFSLKFRRILGADEEGQSDGDGKGARPWAGLVNLLKRYSRHFGFNTKLKGGIRAEYVSLVMDDQ